MIKVWYLHHSSFALKINNKFLVFDYYYDQTNHNNRELSTGVINPEQIKDYDVYVFASHGHHDHFNEVIFDWSHAIPNIKYLLSDDIGALAENTYKLAPNKSYTVDGLIIDTFKSNDEGLAFVISISNLCIFFSGDLNWWHWEEEPDDWNMQKEEEFKSEYDKLKDYNIDLAFIPVDPRLDKSYSKTLEYFLAQDHNSTIFPMHFGENYSIFEWLEKDNLLKEIIKIDHRGQKFTIGD